jgi:pyruvate/2-oxoglutarate/acetoin dehydrogenase E1 component
MTAVQAKSRVVTYRDAVREAIRQAMIEDERVFLMGEDVGRYGGCYAVSKGLLEEFGPDRIRDTPLSEAAFVGAGIGAALGGMRPIVEVMTVNFSLLALDQIVNTASLYLHMSGGQFNVPVVIRMATGAGRQVGAQHSHSLEGWYAHIPGIKVAIPATVEDARWMLPTALADPDPVIIFEHVGLYNIKGDLAEASGPVDLSKAAVRRSGSDVSLITYGGSLPKALTAADELATLGISAEVLDLRVLRPLDVDAIVATVSTTHRAIVIDEGWKTAGVSAEIVASISEQALWQLDGPVIRVCTVEVPIPMRGIWRRRLFPRFPGSSRPLEKRSADDRFRSAIPWRRHGRSQAGPLAGRSGGPRPQRTNNRRSGNRQGGVGSRVLE